MSCFEIKIRASIRMILLLLFPVMLAGCRNEAATGSIEGTHASDVAVLERILEEQTAIGGTIPSDWDDTEHYT